MTIPLGVRSGYNAAPMAIILQHPNIKAAQMSCEELLSACARDRGNSAVWTEFLDRYGPRVRQFIQGTLRMAIGKVSAAEMSGVLGGMQPSDLFQSTIMRLVENDCAALRKFSGESEYEWIAYLAVITRSVVRESLRRQRALKRPGGGSAVEPVCENLRRQPPPNSIDPREVERGFLAQEVRSLGKRAIHSIASESSTRDMLIFRLYFDHDLSFSQIAQCQSVKLSKAGVEKALARLKEIIRSAVSEESSKETTR